MWRELISDLFDGAPDGEPVILGPDQEQALSESIRQIERGESVDGWKLLEELKTQAGL